MLKNLTSKGRLLTIDETRRSLWAVSWMSFFWSFSTLMVEAVLPVFLIEVLKISYTQAGILEGIAIFTAFLFKVFSGILSDIFRTRKPLIALGSFLSVIVKLIYALASSYPFVFTARFVDRLSKGIRSSPTDALIADLSSHLTQGRNFGLRQTLYTLGAVVGAASVTPLMYLSDNNFQLVFCIATIPAVVGFFILLFVVKQPFIPHDIQKKKSSWQLSDVRYLPPAFWKLLGISFVLMLARFSASFITYRAKAVGCPTALLPMLVVAYEIVHASVAYPIGLLADQSSRKALLLKGLCVLVLANIIFICTQNVWFVLLGAMVTGLHMGMTQGLLATLIAESSPSDLRGTAFALYYLSSGTAVLIGNSLAGVLSDRFGTAGAFMGGFVFSTLSVLFLYQLIKRSHQQPAVA